MPGISGKFRVGYTAKDTKGGGGDHRIDSQRDQCNTTYVGVPLNVTLHLYGGVLNVTQTV